MEKASLTPEEESSAALQATTSCTLSETESGDRGSEAAAEGGNTSIEDRVPKFQPRCEVCGITTTSQAHMEAHMAGRKHRRRMETAAGRGAVQQSPHYCAICDISTTSAAHLSLHLVGRAHRRRQKAMEEGEFPLPLSQTAALAAAEQAEALASNPPGQELFPGTSSAAEGKQPSRQSSSAGESSGQYGGSNRSREVRESPVAFKPRDANAHPRSELVVGQRAVTPPTLPPRRGASASPSQPPPYPVNMLQFPPMFYPANPVPHLLPGSGGGHPMYGWWPAAVPQVDHTGHYQPAPMHYPPYLPQGPSSFGVPLHPAHQPGMRRPPMYHQSSSRGRPGAKPTWEQRHGPHTETYNCEVCNVHTDQLDDLKQHLRGKSHMRRLHSAAEGGTGPTQRSL